MDNLNEIRYQEYERKIAEQETIKKEYNLYSDTNPKAEKKESFLKNPSLKNFLTLKFFFPTPGLGLNPKKGKRF